MSESLDLTEFDIEQLIAWLTAYLRIYVIALYTSCALICALFVTNRLIIHWNDQNDHPHQADGPVYGMLANSWNKKHMEPTKRSYGGNEKSIVSSIKKGAAHAYEALGMANDSVTVSSTKCGQWFCVCTVKYISLVLTVCVCYVLSRCSHYCRKISRK